MKSIFNKFIFSFLSIVFFSSFVSAKEMHSEYIIEVGKIDVGKVFWSITLDATKYKTFIKLEDRGIFSGLYSFNGIYSTEGRYINNSFVPSSYTQKWVTKSKKRSVELYFTNGVVSKLNLIPGEELPPKIEYLGVGNAIDPLSSFLNILKNNNPSRTIDGRRFYKMVVENKDIKNNIITKNINIKEYLNIWADHNNNDLNSIQFEHINDNKLVLPHKIKIKFKGLVFKLSKI